MARYDAGETLASIARTYDCSPPAISYVVSRSRARASAAPPASQSGPNTTETQLVKAAPEPVNGASKSEPANSGEAALRPLSALGQRVLPGTDQRPDDRPRESASFVINGANGGAATLPPPRAPSQPQHSAVAPIAAMPNGNGDARRRLHLSLGAHPQGDATSAEPHPAARPVFTDHGLPQPQTRQFTPPERPSYNSASQPEPSRAANGGNGSQRKEGGAFIDSELRARVDDDIAAFLAAFDAALSQDTQDNRRQLREATDRLLRAGARTRIELERLEARVPLPPRDNGGGGQPGWRPR